MPSGRQAKVDGDCARCPRPILKGDRYLPHKGRWIHVECASGADDAPRRNMKTSPAGGAPETPEVSVESTPQPAGDPPTSAGGQPPGAEDGPVGSEAEAPTVPPADPRREKWKVVKPCVVDGMPNDVYHSHPNPWPDSISSSGIKLMLQAPAIYHSSLTNERVASSAMNLGSAAHYKVLGEGPKVVAHGHAEIRSNAAKAEVAAIIAAGNIPLRPKEAVVVDAMAAELEKHPLASLLFANGKAEQSAFYVDPDTAVRCRARFDWLPHKVEGKRLIVPDFKTATNADPRAFGRSAYEFGYEIQAAHYRQAIISLGLDENPGFLFVVQMTSPPYLVAVNQLDAPSAVLGEKRRLRALEMYLECLLADEWPGYGQGVHQTTLPAYAFYDQERYEMTYG